MAVNVVAVAAAVYPGGLVVEASPAAPDHTLAPHPATAAAANVAAELKHS
jgi:hypothetical protein